jgi:hypothetical protein
LSEIKYPATNSFQYRRENMTQQWSNRVPGESAMAVDLSIEPDTVRTYILKARAISANLSSDYDDGSEHDTELDPTTLTNRHSHEGLQEEESEDLTLEELSELLDDLNIDEATELVAIVWIGRGDYEAGDWDEAVNQARERAVGPTSRYLLGMPLLGDHLESGLNALGH